MINSAIQPGDSVLVLGAGSNGMMLAQLARQQGAVRVIIIDPIAYRLQRALDAGIDYVLEPESELANLLQHIYVINDGRKPDIVLVTPSSVSAMQQGLELIGHGGTVLFFAPPPPTSVLPITPNTLFFQEMSLHTSYSAGPYETRLALDLLRLGRIRPESVITHHFPLKDAAAAFKLVAKPGDALKVVIAVDS